MKGHVGSDIMGYNDLDIYIYQLLSATLLKEEIIKEIARILVYLGAKGGSGFLCPS